MKKVFSILLALIMVLSLLPTVAMAEVAPAVAQIGTATYTTLAAAVASATDSDTIELLDDVALNEQLTIDKAITLDGKDKTITSTATGKGAILVTAGATIQNLTVEGPNTKASDWDNGEYGIKVYNASGVTLKDVTVTAANAGILVDSSAVTLKGAIDVSGNEFGGIEVCKGENIENAGALTIDTEATVTCTNTNVPAIWIDGTENAAGTVTNNSKTVLREVKKTGNSDKQTYFWTTGNVAAIGNVGYATLADAVAAAEANKTVTLTGDVELSQQLVIDKAITLDGANKKITVGSNAYVNVASADGATIKNVNFIGLTGLDNQTAAVYISELAKGTAQSPILISGCSFTGSDAVASAAQAMGITSTNCFDADHHDYITVSGCTFKNLKYAMYFNQAKNLTVTGNVIDGTKYNAINVAATGYDCENITIADNTMTNLSAANYNSDLYSAGLSFGPNAKNVKITSGSVSMQNSKKAVYAEAGADVSVTGGTFSSNPIDYVATGYAVSKNGDTYTVAAAKNTAAVDVTNNNGEVTISSVTTDTNATVNVIDVKSFEAESIKADKTTLSAVINKTATNPVEFVLKTNTSVEFNKEAVRAIAGNMGDTGNITLVVKPNATVTDITDGELAAKNTVAASNNNAKVVTLELKQVNTNLFTKSTGAKAEVTVPFTTMPTGNYQLYVYYLNPNGKAEFVGIAAVNKGVATFEVEHFSSYALVPTYVGGHGGGSYTPSAAQTITTDLPAGSITKVTVDGKTVDSKYYTISGGNVTLTDAYIKTLSNGKHTVAIENATHISKATITVNNAVDAATVKSGKTGDAGILLYGALALMSVTGGAVIIGKKKKYE